MNKIMSHLKKVTLLYTLPIFFTWFIATIFVDIIAVPNVFRNVSSVVEAGKVGLAVFSNFNKFELFFGILACLGLYFETNMSKAVKAILIAFFIIWPLLYIFKMTPEISAAALQMNSVLKTDPLYIGYKEHHSYYHSLYRTLDSIKILVLLFSLIYISIIKLKEQK